ncbi:transglycosylase domain-containing protein [Desulfofarcimen acetoxidans]|uniref:transglycosylase domain-containing protein n=1 Tax=Desulfofarcimen acetoxidans TaxID=58138 RepID=UPI003BEEE133
MFFLTENEKKKKLNWFRLFLLIGLLVLLIVLGTSIGLLISIIVDLPDINIKDLKYNAATLIYDQNDNLITKIGTENRIPVKINEVPKVVQNAFLAVEDVRFYQHHGIDIRGIARAAWQNITTGKIKEGASTITQQLARDIYLNNDQKYKRKIQEIFLALMLERKLSKEEILELYLNRIYFGEGSYGIKTAAETYFGKKLNELGLKEAALLAGLPQAPSSYSPYQNKDLALKRRNLVLENMLKYNYINNYDYNNVVNADLGTLTEPAAKKYPYPFYIDYVTEHLIARYGESQVFTGGLIVHIAMDKKMQTIAEEVISNKNNFPTADIQGAAVVINPHNGYITALVGGREHTNMRQWNRATQTYRQPGSAFKPIIAYGPAIELKGKGPASVVDDSPIRIGSWSPRNSNGKFSGLTTLRNALTYSINIVSVKLLQEVTIPKARDFAKKIGISSLDPKYDVGLSMALGGLHQGVTPLELAGAYGAFANLGTYNKPIAITQVKKSDGTVLWDTQQSIPVQAMKPTTAYLITDMLQSAVQRGTGTAAQISRPAAGKTGTTENGKDIWFAGYTPELVGIVWMGYDDPKPTPYFGGEYSARIWHNIMGKILEGQPLKQFPRPDNIVSATVDSKSGLLPGPNTPDTDKVTDLFAAENVPKKVDTSHVLVEVCAVSGMLPNEYCPDRVTKVFLKTGTFSSSVADSESRVPTGVCTVHGPETSNKEVEAETHNITPQGKTN